MLALIIISSLLLVIALLNWGQSEGFFHRIVRFFNKHASLDEEPVQHSYMAGADGTTVIDTEDFEDYAYDDDSDYCSQ